MCRGACDSLETLIAVMMTNTCSWRCTCRQQPSHAHALARETRLIDMVSYTRLLPAAPAPRVALPPASRSRKARSRSSYLSRLSPCRYRQPYGRHNIVRADARGIHLTTVG